MVIRTRVFAAVALSGAMLLGLAECGPKRLKADFKGFEKAYAETSNREMLLNLARLQNRDPTYFFKLGQISSSYTMNASLTGSGTYALQGTTPGGGAATGGGTPLVGIANTPSFTFIPVNDDTNAQLLLRPVLPETFYILYQQGWRVDQLFRLMVDRIEVTQSDAKGCMVETIRNVPPPPYAGPGYERNPEALSGYATFLRVSALAYALQKHGHLLLKGAAIFVPYDDKAGIADPPKATDIIAASAKNQVWKPIDGKWILGENVTRPVFYLNPAKAQGSGFVADQDLIRTELEELPDLAELRSGPSLGRMLRILANGFSVAGSNRASDGECSGGTTLSAHLVMRSLMGMMTAAAQEEDAFDELIKHDPLVPLNRHLTKEEQGEERPRFSGAVPRLERIPLLRLRGQLARQGGQPVVQLEYRGTEYRIADLPAPGDDPENQYWNRDVFRLISQLTAQVTVDISKFPLQTLQLRTQ